MATKPVNRLLVLGVVAGLTAFGYAAKAQADVLFHNDTTRPIHFGFSCGMGSQDAWTVKPNQTKALYCANGAHTASVEIRTDHGTQDAVVRMIVHDGREYHLAYDGDGDVNIH